MVKNKNYERARLETLLAQAHRTMGKLADYYLATDQWSVGDDLTEMQRYLANRLEAELKKDRGLKTRP